MIFKEKEPLKIDSHFGGNGTIEIYKHVKKDDLENIYMLANVVLPKGTSIGYHLHDKDSEIYHVIKGKGLFIDENKEEHIVHKNDCCVIKKGQSHGIENIGDEDLEFIAILF